MSMPVVDGAVRNLKKVQNHIDSGMDDILDVVAQLGDGQEMLDEDEMAVLERVMMDYAGMARKLKQFTQAVDQVKTQIKRAGPEEVDVMEALDSVYQELSEGNTDSQLLKDKKVTDFRNRQQELRDNEEEEEEAGPSSLADQSLGEEELVMTQTEVGTKCPFTQQDMIHPVVNTLCGHHYDQGFTKLLNKRKKIRCPLPGCINEMPISLDHLQPDREFQRKIEKQLKANKRKQADTQC